MARREERKPRVQNDGFDKVLVEVRRVTKVVKGGRTLRMSALVIVGNKKGQIGFGLGKAIETNDAIEKATQQAKKNLIKAIELNPTNKDYYYNLAYCYKELHKEKQAKKILETYKKMS